MTINLINFSLTHFCQDMYEWEEKKRERELSHHKHLSSPASTSTDNTNKPKLSRTDEIHERIGYKPQVVQQPMDSSMTVPPRRL